ncbi:MAG: DUF4843 domain-containing protein [Dysgonamonadaceae bacterium]|jgi:hypothetical protein|nr:DUF4843 domain-containing protein [Dysgonamonadaceae bacterium]
MKNRKIFFVAALLASIAMLSSCEQETIPTYSGEDQIYFTFADETATYYIVDSTFIKFGYDLVIKSDSIVGLNVKVQGNVTDYDRPIAFGLVESESSAQLGRDVEMLLDMSYIPAGKAVGKIYVRLKNTEALDGNQLRAVIGLQKNEYFDVKYLTTLNTTINSQGYMLATHFKIYFDNANEMPNIWAHPTYRPRFEMFFGAYSAKKFALLCELFGVDRDYFTYPPESTSTEITAFWNSHFPMALLQGWARSFNIYLNQMRENGTPVLEDDGTEMTGASDASWQ